MCQVITDKRSLQLAWGAAHGQLILDPILASTLLSGDQKAWLDFVATEIDNTLVFFQVQDGSLKDRVLKVLLALDVSVGTGAEDQTRWDTELQKLHALGLFLEQIDKIHCV